jgi:hypothetical protein
MRFEDNIENVSLFDDKFLIGKSNCKSNFNGIFDMKIL